MVPDVIPTVPTQKHHKDHITPHKIALMVLIKEFCSVKIKTRMGKLTTSTLDENVWFHTNQQNRDMAIALLKLIQNPDMDLKELNSAVNPILHPRTYGLFAERLKDLKKNRVSGIMDYIQTLEPLLLDLAPNSPVVHKSSVIGLFIRRMLLAFDKLSFNHIKQLFEQFCDYYDWEFNCSEQAGDTDISESCDDTIADISNVKEEGCHVLASQKQAEFFIAQQAALLQINEKEALSPPELQQKIRELLKGNPVLTEAHYLSFLNNLRVKEFCGSIEYLHHHFDRNTTVPHESKIVPPSEDLTRSYRYAALNLAMLHARFGHKNEALAALKEAIMVAQEVNDNVCLQHALTWLYRLTDDNIETLIERSISKSSELNLWYLSSLGIQALTQIKCVTITSPACIFDLVMKSDIFNCQHSMTENIGSAYAQRAALWAHYGNSCMVNLISKLLLVLNTSDPVRGGIYHVSEGTCLALRNLAMNFAQEGKYNHATTILSLAKELFPPHTENSHIWKLCELIIDFEKNLYLGNWSSMEKILSGIAIIDLQEKDYRNVQLFLSQGNMTKAHEIIKNLLADCKAKELSPHFHVRVLLLKASLLCQTENFSMAIPSLMQCLEITKLHHLLYLESLTTLYLASVQLMLNLPNEGLQLLDSIFISILSHGSCYDKGCCYMLYAKCTAAAASFEDNCHIKTKALLLASNFSESALKFFMKIKAVHKAKYVLCWQAQLYNQLDMKPNRNASAYQFRNIDQQYPCSNWHGILIP